MSLNMNSMDITLDINNNIMNNNRDIIVDKVYYLSYQLW